MQFWCTDGNDELAGTVDKRAFILLNGPPYGYTGIQKFFQRNTDFNVLESLVTNILLESAWTKVFFPLCFQK